MIFGCLWNFLWDIILYVLIYFRKVFTIFNIYFLLLLLFSYVYTDKCTHAHTGILLSYKDNEIMTFTTVYMDIKDITLSEIRERKKNTIWFNIHGIWKQNEQEKQNGNKFKDTRNKLVVARQVGWEDGKNKWKWLRGKTFQS